MQGAHEAAHTHARPPLRVTPAHLPAHPPIHLPTPTHPPTPLSRSVWPAERRVLRMWPVQRLHLWPHLSRRELPHRAPPGRVLDDRAGNGVLHAGGWVGCAFVVGAGASPPFARTRPARQPAHPPTHSSHPPTPPTHPPPPDDMACAEDYVRYCCSWLLQHCRPDLDFIASMIDKGCIERLEQVCGVCGLSEYVCVCVCVRDCGSGRLVGCARPLLPPKGPTPHPHHTHTHTHTTPHTRTLFTRPPRWPPPPSSESPTQRQSRSWRGWWRAERSSLSLRWSGASTCRWVLGCGGVGGVGG